MKRPVVAFCAFTTLIFVCLIIFRATTKKQASPNQPSQHLVDVATEIADAFALVKTRPLSTVEFSKAVYERTGTNGDLLSENERKKLLTCINQFYSCYSSGNYQEFKQFRLHPPYVMNETLVSASKKITTEKGLKLETDDDILRYYWDNYNGTNRISEVGLESIHLSLVNKTNMGADLRLPSVAKWPELATPMCWEGAIVYQPPPDDLLKMEGVIRFFTLEMFVRFAPHKDGPATPIVLLGYWDPKRQDWLPHALCTMLRAGSYDTIF